MSVIATIDVEAADFVLEEVLASVPDIEISLERVVPVGSMPIPYFWIENEVIEDIERTLRAGTSIDSFTIVDRLNGEALVRVTWNETPDGFLDVIAASDGTILEAVGSGDGWTFQLRFDDQESLTDFYRQCANRDIRFELQNVYNPGLPERHGLDVGITETQRKTLRYALEAGYFDVPRKTNLTDLADGLGISDTAVSQRIRRGLTKLLVATFSESDGEPDP